MAIKRLDHINFVTADMPATIDFYCTIIGLEHGKELSISSPGHAYFYIPGVAYPVLHVSDASLPDVLPTFTRYAHVTTKQDTPHTTGPLDHVCLVMDFDDYDAKLATLQQHALDYKTYCHQDKKLKQIWVFDPNGIRVELNFTGNE